MFIFIIVALMLSGVFLGYIVKSKRLFFIRRIITLLIWLLLFLLGVEVGNNRAIIEGLFTLGVEALVITLAAVVGSVLASWLLWTVIVKHRKGAGDEG